MMTSMLTKTTRQLLLQRQRPFSPRRRLDRARWVVVSALAARGVGPELLLLLLLSKLPASFFRLVELQGVRQAEERAPLLSPKLPDS